MGTTAVRVKEAVLELLRAAGVTTIFGNPGSNEIPFISDLPEDFRYIAALHEGAVVAIADGYAQASGGPALVSLHAAAGTGNGLGALTNASVSKTPLIVVAGQQARPMVVTEAMLTIPEPAVITAPFTRWSCEPLRPQDVPAAFARAIARCTLPPAGPVFLAIPLDDWRQPADPVAAKSLRARDVVARNRPCGAVVDRLTAALDAAKRPTLVVGGETDCDKGFRAAVALAEGRDIPVFAASEAYRFGFPTASPLFAGQLPTGRADVAAKLAEFDLVLVFGAPAFKYHQFQEGPFLAPGTSLISVGDDPDQIAYTQAGDSVFADPVETLVELVAASGLSVAEQWRGPRDSDTESPASSGTPLDVADVFRALNSIQPDDAAWVVEAPSSTGHFFEHIKTRYPRSFYFPAAGGLGFGLPATVGVALALPNRPVVGIIGDGSAHYGITALWTAAQLGLPLTICYLRNGSYAALEDFAAALGETNVPGLELPGIDIVSIARGYGVAALSVRDAGELPAALAEARDIAGPVLIEIPVRPPGSS